LNNAAIYQNDFIINISDDRTRTDVELIDVEDMSENITANYDGETGYIYADNYSNSEEDPENGRSDVSITISPDEAELKLDIIVKETLEVVENNDLNNTTTYTSINLDEKCNAYLDTNNDLDVDVNMMNYGPQMPNNQVGDGVQQRCIHRTFVHEVPHVCPIHTKIINHHIYKHTYRPVYTCSEENVCSEIQCGSCCNFR
jgi:hypothetical protein